jgi:hypothetical protein
MKLAKVQDTTKTDIFFSNLTTLDFPPCKLHELVDMARVNPARERCSWPGPSHFRVKYISGGFCC